MYFGKGSTWNSSNGGSKTYFMTIKGSTGNVGIGTQSPGSKLEVYSSDGNTAKGLILSQGSSSNNNHSARLFFENTGSGESNNSFTIVKRGDFLDFRSNATAGSISGTTRMTLKNNGNAALYGKFEAKEIQISNSPTADFVFEESYKIPTLEFIDKFVKENKHLPEIASAKEMEENGVNVGQFQIQLLQKIEELTLYTIDQEKEIKKQNKDMKSLNERLAKLEKLLNSK